MRRNPLLVGAVAALGCAVALGLGWLQTVFLDERRDALTTLSAEREALQNAARRALRERLDVESDLRLARARRAVEDVFEPDEGTILIEGGRVLLPRRIPPFSRQPSGARALYEALAAGLPVDLDDEPFAERTAIVARMARPLSPGEDRGAVVEAALHDLDDHRFRYVLDPRREAALLALAAERAAPTRGIAALRLVREVQRRGALTAPGLGPLLVSARARLSEDEVRFFADVAARACLAAGSSCPEVAERALAKPRDPDVKVPSLLGPLLAGGGRLLYAPKPGDVVVGAPVDLAAHLAAVAAELEAGAPLLEAPRLVTGELRDAVAPDALPLTLQDPRYERAARAVEERFLLKSGLVGLVGALAALVFVLGALLQRRRARYVEMKASLVAAVSHELKTPLSSMRLLVESLERRIGDDPRARDYARRLLHDVDDLTELVEEILGFQRLQKGRIVLKKSVVSLDELCAGVVEEAKARASREVDVRVDGAAGVAVQADPDLLRLALRNLVGNAVQHNERTPIRVAVQVEQGEGVSIRVRDNGVGIPPGEERRVFEEFHRPQRPGRPSRGSGLGLALTRRVVELHGGKVRVEDTSPAGTTFEVTIPKGRSG